MANIITIKSGTSTPSAGTLHPNELGYNKTDNTLYIGLLNGGISALCKPPVQIINSSSLYTDYASAKAVYNYAPSRTGANASGNWDINAHGLYMSSSAFNVVNIAYNYSYGDGSLYINYNCSLDSTHPITSYYLWNGLGSATGAGLANLHCKDITCQTAQIGGHSMIDWGYPVGAVYISTISTSPASLFGGTWEQIKGRFLLAADGTYGAGTTGGEASHALSIDEMPKHNHGYEVRSPLNNQSGAVQHGFADYNNSNWWAGTWSYVTAAGGGQPHNNMPPYLAVYMWKRIA